MPQSLPEDWEPQPAAAFDALVGPLYFPPGGDQRTCGFVADARHTNRRGMVHGGMISTAFDVALGRASRTVSAPNSHATLQMSMQFVSAMMPDEFAVIRSEVVRATSSVIFVRAVMSVGDRVVATADGIWKILRAPDATRSPA